MGELSLNFYVSISNGDDEVLRTFRKYLLQDFESMHAKFFSAVKENNIPAMRAELHKMYPIACNLNFSQLLDLIEKYQHSEPFELARLHDELKICLAKVFDLLKSE